MQEAYEQKEMNKQTNQTAQFYSRSSQQDVQDPFSLFAFVLLFLVVYPSNQRTRGSETSSWLDQQTGFVGTEVHAVQTAADISSLRNMQRCFNRQPLSKECVKFLNYQMIRRCSDLSVL